MSRFKKALRWGSGILVVVVVVAAGVDLICETSGLPKFARKRILARMRDNGVCVKCDNIRMGLVNWLVMEDVVVVDPLLDEYQLATIKRIHVNQPLLFDGPLTCTMTSASINVPLSNPNHEPTLAATASAIDCDVTYDRRTRLLELKGKGTVFDRIETRISFAGNLPVKKKEKPRPLSVAPYLDVIKEHHREIVRRIKDIAASATERTKMSLNLVVKSDLEAPQNSSVSAVAEINHLLYNGMVFERVQGKASISEGAIAIDNLELQIEETESVKASVHFDRKTRKLRAKVNGQTYPKKLARAFLPDDVVLKLNNYECLGPPPSFRVTLHPTPVASSMLDADVGFSFEVRDTEIFDGRLKSASVQGRYRNRELKITKLDGTMSPSVDVTATGHVDFRTGDALIRVVQDGPPRTICKFIRDEKFRKGMNNGLKGFSFSPLARPHIEAEIFRTMRKGKPHTTLIGELSGKALAYNGVDLDSVQGSVIIDFTRRRLVIPRVHVDRDGAPASGQLAIQFAKNERRIDFDAASNLQSSALMQLIRPNWRDLLHRVGWRFEYTPNASGSGYVNLVDHKDYQVRVHVQTPTIGFHGTSGTAADVNLLFNHDGIHADGAFGSLKLSGAKLDDVSVKGFRFKDKSVTAQATARSAEIGGAQFEKISGKVTSDLKDLIVHQVKCAAVNVPGSDNQRLRMEDVDSDKLIFGLKGGFRGSGHAALVWHGTNDGSKIFAQAKDLDVTKLVWAQKRLGIEGKMKNFCYGPLSANADSASLTCTVGKNTVNSDIHLPELKLDNGLRLIDINVHTDTEKGQTQAGFTIARLAYENMNGSVLSGRYKQQGTSFQITDLKCQQLDVPPFRIASAKGSAVSAFGTIRMELMEGQGFIIPKPSKKGQKQRPMEIDKLEATLLYKDHILDIRKVAGGFYGGSIKAQGTSNLAEKEVRINLDLSGVDMEKLSKRAGGAPKGKEAYDGRLVARASLHLSQDKKGWNIFGFGDARLRNASLWKLPLVADFLSLVGAKFGKITKMECGLRFSGDRIDILDLKTNGTVLALKASGHYWWKTDGVDIGFQAIPLGLNLPFLKTVFARRMIGVLNDYKWKLFSSSSKIIDPAPKPVPLNDRGGKESDARKNNQPKTSSKTSL